MTVLCKETQSLCNPLVLPRNEREEANEENFVVSSEWYTIDSLVSGYNLTKNHQYIVYGIMYFGSTVRYLIFDDKNVPGFFPSTLFVVYQPNVPDDWEIKEYFVGNDNLLFIGLPMVCKSYDNLIRLLDCVPDAVENILNYKEYELSNYLFYY